jgi:putative membrane protein
VIRRVPRREPARPESAPAEHLRLGNRVIGGAARPLAQALRSYPVPTADVRRRNGPKFQRRVTVSYLKLAVTAALLTCTVGVRADDKKPVDFDDVAFTIIATSCGLHEIELGKVVEKKSTNAEVKAFAAQVVKDHTAINEELKVAAKSARISISQKMDDAHQKQLDAFEDYKGTNFDGDYLKHTAEKHKQFVALLKRASKEAKNKELRDFATKNLPTVEGHIEKANKLIK